MDEPYKLAETYIIKTMSCDGTVWLASDEFPAKYLGPLQTMPKLPGSILGRKCRVVLEILDP
jgi:hypothetical protein